MRERYGKKRKGTSEASGLESKRTQEEAALLWMNGGYFHSDLEKYEELEKAPSRAGRMVQVHTLATSW